MARKSLVPHVMMGFMSLLIGGSVLGYGIQKSDTPFIVVGAIAVCLGLYRLFLVVRVAVWRSRHPLPPPEDEKGGEEGDGGDEPPGDRPDKPAGPGA